MKEAVVAYIRNDEGKFLLLYHVNQDYWTPPGGKVEPDDWNTRESICREVFEEVNYDVMQIKDWTPQVHCNKVTTTITHECGDENWILHLYYIPFYNEFKDKLINNEPEKHSSMKWFSIEEIEKLPKVSYSVKLLLGMYKCFDEYIIHSNTRD